MGIPWIASGGWRLGTWDARKHRHPSGPSTSDEQRIQRILSRGVCAELRENPWNLASAFLMINYGQLIKQQNWSVIHCHPLSSYIIQIIQHSNKFHAPSTCPIIPQQASKCFPEIVQACPSIMIPNFRHPKMGLSENWETLIAQSNHQFHYQFLHNLWIISDFQTYAPMIVHSISYNQRNHAPRKIIPWFPIIFSMAVHLESCSRLLYSELRRRRFEHGPGETRWDQVVRHGTVMNGGWWLWWPEVDEMHLPAKWANIKQIWSITTVLDWKMLLAYYM